MTEEYSACIKNDNIIVYLGEKEISLTTDEFNKLSNLVHAAKKSNIGMAFYDKDGNIHTLYTKNEE